MVRAYLTVKLIQWVAPWVGRLLLLIPGLLMLPVAAFWVGIPNAVEAIVTAWINRLVAWGWPTVWDVRTYKVLKATAYGFLVMDFIFISHVTVVITRILF